jgi:hypothetical protein
MPAAIRRTVPIGAAIALALAVASTVEAAGRVSPLAGRWTGTMHATSSAGGFSNYKYTIVVRTGGRGGSWRLNASCRGPLVLIGHRHGYARFREGLSPTATCLGGGVDQLERRGAKLYDSYQSHAGSKYNSTGTLHRAR